MIDHLYRLGIGLVVLIWVGIIGYMLFVLSAFISINFTLVTIAILVISYAIGTLVEEILP